MASRFIIILFSSAVRKGSCPHTKRALGETPHTCDARCGVGAWAVVQQGMNQNAGTARRYHWFSQNVKDLVCEPHTGITSEIEIPSLNMVAKNSENSRAISLELSNATYTGLMKDIQILRRHVSRLSQTLTIGNQQGDLFTVLNLVNTEFHHHPVEREEFSRSKYLEKILSKVTSEKPESYEKFLAMEGVGPKTVRALALVGEIIYGAKPSYEDPARYSFAFGGKDATPYPVDRPTYDKAISLMHRAASSELRRAVQKSRIGSLEKEKIVRRLENGKS